MAAKHENQQVETITFRKSAINHLEASNRRPLVK